MPSNLDSVKWFRGFAEGQYEACDNLFYSLRDDLEQGSWYRTLECLHCLGLLPLPPVKLLRTIMAVSQASDLAFLFFLWEAAYKSHCEDEYTINEQLLLSAIAHLDMMSTMRELDRILPPSTHSKKDWLRRRRAELAAEKPVRTVRLMKTDPQVLPYFYKLRRPQEHRSKFTSSPKGTKVYFPLYENYADKMYAIRNEQNRWFTQYEPQPMRRVIKHVIADTFERIFLNSDTQALTEKQNYCFAHRKYRKLMFAKAAEVKHKALQRCLELSDLAGIEAKKRRERIVGQLERAVNNCHAQLKQYARRQYPEVATLKGDHSSCEFCKQVFSVPPKHHNPNVKLLMGLDRQADVTTQYETHDSVRVQVLKDNVQMNRFSEFDELTNLVCVESRKVAPEPEEPVITVELPKPGAVKLRRGTGMAEVKDAKKGGRKKPKAEEKPKKPKIPTNPPILRPLCTNNVLKRELVKRPLPPIFFQANSMNIPHQFDYPTIFDLNVTTEDQQQCVRKPKSTMTDKIVHKHIVNALNADPIEDCDEVSELEERLEGGACTFTGRRRTNEKGDDRCPIANGVDMSCGQMKPEEIDEAIKSCVKRMLKAKPHKTHMLGTSGSSESMLEDEISRPCGETFGLEKYFLMPYIDPDDSELMSTMLRSAIKATSRNPKFVLASLPHADKMPVLLDWIAGRYHKTYSIAELDEAIALSMQQYKERLRAMPRQEPEPNVKKYLVDTEGAKQDYFKILNKTTLEKTRLIYWGMRGYSVMCKNTRNPFFAFQPSREGDITRFKPWKSCDFRNFVFLRDLIKMRNSRAGN